MRRLFLAVALVAVVAGCADRPDPLGPSTWERQLTSSSQGEDPRVWILGRTYTMSDGTVCTFVESESQFGVECGDAFHSWAGFTYNTDLYPVVEICRLHGPGDACLTGAADRASFVRKPGEIRVFNTENGKYRLTLDKDVGWWSGQPDGTYRVTVGITFTGLDGLTPVPGWDHQSDKVLGSYEFTRDGQGNHQVQFRIRDGALCEDQDSESCVEIAVDPAVRNTIVLDEDYELTDGEGIVGLQLPAIGAETIGQQKINIIIERLNRQHERCIAEAKFVGSGFAPGNELEPCYSIRTEPYIDLAELGVTEAIRFGVCLDEGASRLGGLLQMLKWSSVKNQITDLGLSFEDGFFTCPADYDPTLASLPAAGTSRFARAAGRVLSPMESLFWPRPLHASYVLSRSPGNGSLMDFSTIVVQADESYDPVFLSPIGASTSSLPNLGPVANSVTVDLCLKTKWDVTLGTCEPNPPAPGAPHHWTGTAYWNGSEQAYQANWNTPREQVRGTYRLTLSAQPYIQIAPHEINVSFEESGKFSHNAGRTLPIKFFLTTAQ
jgi:hypothetical protein